MDVRHLIRYAVFLPIVHDYLELVFSPRMARSLPFATRHVWLDAEPLDGATGTCGHALGGATRPAVRLQSPPHLWS